MLLSSTAKIDAEAAAPISDPSAPWAEEEAMVDALCEHLALYQAAIAPAFIDRLRTRYPHLKITDETVEYVEKAMVPTIAMIGSELRRPERIIPSLTALASGALGPDYTAQDAIAVSEAMRAAVQEKLGALFCPIADALWRSATATLIDFFPATRNEAGSPSHQ